MLLRQTKKTTSLFLAVIILLSDAAFAKPPRPPADRVETKPAFEVYLPPELGMVRETHLAGKSNRPFIFHLQTVHANYENALKTSEIIRYLKSKYKANLLFVEGASERLRPEFLKFFPNPEMNGQMLDQLARKGELTGVDLALSRPTRAFPSRRRKTGTRKLTAVGIESLIFYRSTFKIFKKVISNLSQSEAMIAARKRELDAKASRVFSREFRDLVDTWRKYDANHRDFNAVVQFLKEEAKSELDLDFENPFSQFEWPELARLVVLSELEKRADPVQYEREKEKIKTWLAREQIHGDFIPNLDSEQLKTPRNIYEKFLKETYGRGFRLSDYPQAAYRSATQVLQNEFDAEMLFFEIDRLFESLFQKKARTKQELKLLRGYQRLQLLSKLLRLELRRDDWGKVKQIFRRRQAVWGKKSGSPKPSPADDIYRSAFYFYRLCEEREKVFYQKLSREMRARKETVAILVTGGFHSEGMAQLFKEKGVGYAEIMPRINGDINSALYHQIMLGKAHIEKPEFLLPRTLLEQIDSDRVRAEFQTVEEIFHETAKTFSAEEENRVKRQSAYFIDRRGRTPLQVKTKTGEPSTAPKTPWQDRELSLSIPGPPRFLRSEVRAKPSPDRWLSQAIRQSGTHDRWAEQAQLESLPVFLPRFQQMIKREKAFAEGVEERLTDEGSALDILLEQIKDEIFFAPFRTINLVMISLPMGSLNGISKSYWPGFSDFFKKRLHQKLIRYRMDAAFFGTRIVIAYQDPIQAQRNLFSILQEAKAEIENESNVKSLSPEDRRGFKTLFDTTLDLLFLSHVDLFLMKPPSKPPLTDPSDLTAYMEQEARLKPREISPKDFEAMSLKEREKFVTQSDGVRRELREKWSLAASYWFREMTDASTPEEKNAARPKANFFIERLLQDAIARLYERGEVLEKATGALQKIMEVRLARQSEYKKGFMPILDQEMVDSLKLELHDDPVLAQFYEALQEGRRSAPPIFEYRRQGAPRMAGMPRRGHLLGNLERLTKNLEQALQKLERQKTGPALKVFKKTYRDYQLARYEVLVLSYRDPRLEEYYKRDLISEVMRADEAGLLDDFKKRLLGLSKTLGKKEIRARFERLAELIQPGFLAYKRPVGDEAWFAVKTGSRKYGVMFSELNWGRSFFLFHPPDEKDSVYHEILLAFWDLNKQRRAQGTKPWWGALLQFDDVIRRHAPDLYSTKAKVLIAGAMERMDAFVHRAASADPTFRFPTYARDRQGGFWELHMNNEKTWWARAENVRLRDLRPFETLLTSARNYESLPVDAGQINRVSGELEALVDVQKKNPLWIHQVMSSGDLKRIAAGKPARSEVRVDREEQQPMPEIPGFLRQFPVLESDGAALSLATRFSGPRDPFSFVFAFQGVFGLKGIDTPEEAYRNYLKALVEQSSAGSPSGGRIDWRRLPDLAALIKNQSAWTEPVNIIRIYDRIPEISQAESQVLADFLARNRNAKLLIQIAQGEPSRLRQLESDFGREILRRRKAAGDDFKGISVQVVSTPQAYLKGIRTWSSRAMVYGDDAQKLNDLFALTPHERKGNILFVQKESGALGADELKEASDILAALDRLLSPIPLPQGVISVNQLTERIALEQQLRALVSVSA